MNVTWTDLLFLPSEEALAELYRAWAWFLPNSFRPVIASTLGDVFFQQESDAIFWLNTGTAQITQVADSRAQFLELLKGEDVNIWFMPSLVEKLKMAGKLLKPDHCYTFVRLPIFKEGKYEVDNLNAVPAKEHFRITGFVHEKIKNLPDGAQVKISVV